MQTAIAPMAEKVICLTGNDMAIRVGAVGDAIQQPAEETDGAENVKRGKREHGGVSSAPSTTMARDTA